MTSQHRDIVVDFHNKILHFLVKPNILCHYRLLDTQDSLCLQSQLLWFSNVLRRVSETCALKDLSLEIRCLTDLSAVLCIVHVCVCHSVYKSCHLCIYELNVHVQHHQVVSSSGKLWIFWVGVCVSRNMLDSVFVVDDKFVNNFGSFQKLISFIMRSVWAACQKCNIVQLQQNL